MAIGRGQVGRRPPPPQRQPPRPRLNQKTKCQQDPDSIACLEEKLSAIRSSPVAVRRSSSVPYDPQIAFGGGGMVLNIIGDQTKALEQQIKKNEMI